MQTLHADLHIHIGTAFSGKEHSQGRAVKITASRDLTFENIAAECVQCKGISIAGIIDCSCPCVLADIERLVTVGEMVELPQGGLAYRDQVTMILGAEVETVEEGGGLSHHVCFLGTLEQMRAFSRWLGARVTNPELSSQNCGLPARKLLQICRELDGLFMVAHAFTPHKSAYGQCVRRLGEMFPDRLLAEVAAVELGLSSDTDLADTIDELHELTFLTNSDAHSLPKIAREHNALELQEASFAELHLALRRKQGRGVTANYGLDPRLGKYHRTVCEACGWQALQEPPVLECGRCGSEQVTRGVLDRIVQIQDRPQAAHASHRPPYQHQVPLEFVPKVGPVTLRKLLNRFGTEMVVLHNASEDELRLTVGDEVARLIASARQGRLELLPGGGGRYGRAVRETAELQLELL